MSVPVLSFFNNKGGVGKTTLAYHLAWMFSDLGLRVVVADLDPQANITATFLDENSLEELLSVEGKPFTIYGCVEPLIEGTADVSEPVLFPVADNLFLLPGSLSLSRFEDELGTAWSQCGDGQPRAFRIITAFSRVLQSAANQSNADLIIADLAPSLGALNRAALVASDFVVIPLAPDLFSLQGLKNLGPTFVRWRREWSDRKSRKPDSITLLSPGGMLPLGYVLQQRSVRLDRPFRAYDKWINRIPSIYREHVLRAAVPNPPKQEDDPYCLGLVKHYRSLMPMAQEARKPIFHLKPADGALGAHFTTVQDSYREFKTLARRIQSAMKNEPAPLLN